MFFKERTCGIGNRKLKQNSLISLNKELKSSIF